MQRHETIPRGLDAYGGYSDSIVVDEQFVM